METLDKDELRKSLLEFFTPEEAEAMIVKAEKDGKFGSDNEDDDSGKPADDKTIDQEAAEKAGEGDDVKKAYDQIMSLKSELDKSISKFFDMFGNMPGVKTPDSDMTKKSIDNDIEKGLDNEITKSFDSIMKGFDKQNEINQEIIKSISDVAKTVNQIAQAPNPMKSIMGQYGFIEKSEKTNEEGKKVISVRNKTAVQSEISKAMDKITDEGEQQVLRNMLSDFTISNRLNPEGLDIVKKALDIDFEK